MAKEDLVCVGVDPDSIAHGVAVYKNGVLEELHNMKRMQLVERFRVLNNVIFSIENALQTNHIFSDAKARNPKTSKHLFLKAGIFLEEVGGQKQASSDAAARNPRISKNIALKVGRQQQAFVELLSDLDYFEIPYVLQKMSKQWKDGKEQIKRFKKETGWPGRSNADTRSAAYMGYLAAHVYK